MILPDNDDARLHAHKVSKQLFGAARTIKILELPELSLRSDIIDWFATGMTEDSLCSANELPVLDELPLSDAETEDDYYTFRRPLNCICCLSLKLSLRG